MQGVIVSVEPANAVRSAQQQQQQQTWFSRILLKAWHVRW